jgi:hypothetical protein
LTYCKIQFIVNNINSGKVTLLCCGSTKCGENLPGCIAGISRSSLKREVREFYGRPETKRAEEIFREKGIN